jgi:hypothetical protein
MRGGQQAACRSGCEHCRQPLLGRQVDSGRRAAQVAAGHMRPQRSAEFRGCAPEQDDRLARVTEPAR